MEGVCACATGGCALFTGSWLQEVKVPVIYPRFFLTIVVQKGWGVLYDVRVLYLAWLPILFSFHWLSAPFPPFYFHHPGPITLSFFYELALSLVICPFPDLFISYICCVVLQVFLLY